MHKLLLYITVLVSIFLNCIAVPTGGPSCNRNDGSNLPNYNACAGQGGLVYCLMTNIDAVYGYNGLTAGSVSPDYHCVQCTTSCDCAFGQYCQDNNNIETGYGTCIDYPNIGAACSSTAIANDVGGGDLYCGVYSSFFVTTANTTVFTAIITGQVCIQGVCAECDSTAVDAGCSTCYATVCNGDPYFSGNGGHLIGTTGLLGPRYCVNNGYVSSGSYLKVPSVLSWIYTLL